MELEEVFDLFEPDGEILYLTDERKKMSKMTLRKKVSLLVVSTLSASILSVVSVQTASAVTSANQGGGSIILATTADADGTATNSVGAGATTVADQTFTSVGYVADTRASSVTSTGGIAVLEGATGTAQMTQPGSIAFRAVGLATTANAGLSVVVTGGTLAITSVATGTQAITLGGTDGTSVALGSGYAVMNGTRTAFVADAVYAATNAAKLSIGGVFTLSSSLAVGQTATISLYGGSDITSTSTATNGTLLSSWQITVVASNAVGVPSLPDSGIFQQPCLTNSSSSGNSGTNAYDTPTACANGSVGVIYVDLDDVYDRAITSASAVTVTASASAGLVTGSASATTGNTINSATQGFSSATYNSAHWFFIKQPVANTAGSAVVTITANGTTIASKTIKWVGDIATLAVDEKNSYKVFSTNQTAETEANIGKAGVLYVAKDAAGNAVTLSSQPSVSAVTGALVGTTLSTSAGTSDSTFAYVQTSALGYGYSTLLVPDNALSGAATYQLQLTNAAGAIIKSQVVPVTVSRGSADSFTAAWDKAVYKPGDIATLTITAKDAYGNLMASGTSLTGLSITKNDTNFATVGTACSASSKFSNGVKTCTYSVGNNDGGYAWSVALDTVSGQSPVLGSASIASGAISNAQVLTEIVKLIAAINKQIRAILRARR